MQTETESVMLLYTSIKLLCAPPVRFQVRTADAVIQYMQILRLLFLFSAGLKFFLFILMYY